MIALKTGGIAIALLGLAAADARAFTLNLSPALEGWEPEEVGFYVNYDNCPVSEERINTALRKAFDLWNSIPTSGLKVKLAGSTDVTVAEATASDAYKNVTTTPVVLCDPDMSATIGTDANSIPGAANFVASSKAILHGYLLLNAESGKTANIGNPLVDKYIDVIVAHEIGHVLGLGHTSDKNALMYFDATAKETLSLSQDDIDAISYLYPRNELGVDGLFGCGSLALLRNGGPDDGDGPSGPGGPFSGGAAAAALEFFLLLLICRIGTRMAAGRPTPVFASAP